MGNAKSETAREVEAFFLLVGALLRKKRTLARGLTVTFAVADHRQAYCLDAESPEGVRPGWKVDADLRVLTNHATLMDLALGRFEPEHPEPHHLLLWAGDRGAWSQLSRTFEVGRSVLATRIDALAGRL